MSREIVDDVLGRGMTRDIWTGNYAKVFPVSIQDFDLSAVLPAVFYTFRYGLRRGKGKFLETFAEPEGTERERRRSATVERVAERLSEDASFDGFAGEVERATLGDLLLCFCLENTKRALGRTEQIQRVAPAHYMASWVDLPDNVGNLRFVPEMVVAMLADQNGEHVQKNQEEDRTWFKVGSGFEGNVLLKAFLAGMRIQGELASRTSDKFDGAASVGIDQLLMIRLAQQLGEAPDKLRGKEGARVSNQRPIAERAAGDFSEDIRRFVRSYAEVIPRQTFVVMLESCMAIGLTTILTSVIELMLEWATTGEIRRKCEQASAPLFVDASNGANRRLRALAEQCFDDYMRRVERVPVVLMVARLLDWGARYDRRIKKLNVATRPHATEWLNLLGNILHNRHEQAQPILYDLEQKAAILEEKLAQYAPEVAAVLGEAKGGSDTVWRLAEALTLLQGRGNTQGNVVECLDSCILVDRPNGLAAKRRVTRTTATSGRKTREVRSMVFTDAALDYLVHVCLLRRADRVQALSYRDFVRRIRDRYGLCVDEAPPGMSVSSDLLIANRLVLERRLRDLGLFVGVNDAEAMKRLKPRFVPGKEGNDGAD